MNDGGKDWWLRENLPEKKAFGKYIKMGYVEIPASLREKARYKVIGYKKGK